ncbi:MAG TPA: hypothetical protein VI873_01070 [Candidatus Peribacteraceae bacterium]|nr:hypothetical protein [Candidatus Peribacteraceae bacterium]
MQTVLHHMTLSDIGIPRSVRPILFFSALCMSAALGMAVTLGFGNV